MGEPLFVALVAQLQAGQTSPVGLLLDGVHAIAVR